MTKEEESFDAICKRLEIQQKWTVEDRNVYRVTKLRYLRSHYSSDQDTCCCIFVLVIVLLVILFYMLLRIDAVFHHFSIPISFKSGN